MTSRRILAYLIPLRILRGHIPSRELLERFPVLDDLYSPFIAAIRSGDVRSYDATLERFEKHLVDLNLYLTMERAREITIRGLFRRVCVFIRYPHATCDLFPINLLIPRTLDG